MSTNTAFWWVMGVSLLFIIGGLVWQEPIAAGIGVFFIAFAIVGTLISDRAKKK